jgi:hypothetical protein
VDGAAERRLGSGLAPVATDKRRWRIKRQTYALVELQTANDPPSGNVSQREPKFSQAHSDSGIEDETLIARFSVPEPTSFKSLSVAGQKEVVHGPKL